MTWPRVALFFCAVIMSGTTAWASPAMPRSLLVVNVVTADTREPIALHVIELYGPVSHRGITDRAGRVAFAELPPGRYRVAYEEPGFERISKFVTIGSSATVRLDIFLVPRQSPPKVIATVKASKPVPLSGRTLTSSSIAARLNQSLVEALGTLPGVALDGAGSVSIGGHLAISTGLTIDGVPAAPLGAATNVATFETDLFSSVGLSSGAGSPSAGGTVDFHLREPTLAWIGSAAAIGTGHSGYGVSVSEGGTVGRLGVSFTHGRRVVGDALEGATFLDDSGLTYSHDTLTESDGDGLKFRYPFSLDHIVTGSLVRLSAKIPIVCEAISGQLPCGYGPGNEQRTNAFVVQLKDSVFFPSGSLQTTVFSTNYHDRFSVGSANGGLLSGLTDSSSDSRLSGFSVAADTVTKGGRSLNLDVSSSVQTSGSDGSIFGAFVPPAPISLHYTSASVGYPLVASRRFRAKGTLGASGVSGLQSGTGGLALAYRVSDSDAISLNLSASGSAAPSGAYAGIAPAGSLIANCTARNSIGSGPTALSGGDRRASIDLSWSHTGSWLQSTASFHRDVDRGASVAGIISGNAIDPSLLDVAYLANATQSFDRQCGSSAALAASDLYFRATLPADHTTYTTASFAAQANIGTRMLLEGSVNIVSARTHGLRGPFASPYSTVIADRQLPGVPSFSASLAAAFALTPATDTMLAFHYVSGNNWNALPAYATLDAGLETSDAKGALAVTITNVLNNHAGAFSTPVGAVPVPMLSGAYSGLAAPLRPRTISIGYRLSLGLRDPLASRVGFATTGIVFLRQTDGVLHDQYLQVDPRAPSCGPESRPLAAEVLNALRAFIADIESAKHEGTYPVSMPARLVAGIALTYRPFGGTQYLILIQPPSDHAIAAKSEAARALYDCGYMHMGSIARFKELDLPYASDADRAASYFAYTPRAGLFRPPDLIEDATQPVVLPSPVVGPDAFSPWQGAACTTALRPAATAILDEMRSAASDVFDHAGQPGPQADIDVAVAGVAGSRWLQFTDRNSGLFHYLAPCFSVTSEPPAPGSSALTWFLGVNYSPELGLFVSR